MTQQPPFKVVLFGAEAVGKTSIIRYSQEAYFDTTIRPTLGAVYLPIKFRLTIAMSGFLCAMSQVSIATADLRECICVT
jgi:GTPase SAR1 family protein